MISCNSDEIYLSEKKVFRYNEISGLQSFDPLYSKNQSHNWFCNHIYSTLVKLDSNLNIIPSISHKWKIKDNGFIYQFKIRDKIYFHESDKFNSIFKNRELTSNDVKYSLDRIKDISNGSPGYWIMENVNEIKIIDSKTLEIILNKRNPYFLELLSMKYCSIIPKESEFIEDFFQYPVGTGPFKFKYHKLNTKLILTKNNYYYEYDSFNNRLPYIDAISISFIPDKQTSFLEFIKGNLEFISDIENSYKNEILNKNGYLKEKFNQKFNFNKSIFFNTEYLGILVDHNQINSNLLIKDFRMALNNSIDKDKIIKYLRNNIGNPGIGGFIPKGMNGHIEKLKIGNYNLKKSKKIIDNFKKKYTLNNLNIYTTPAYVDISEFIQNSWQNLGIDVNLIVSPPSTHREIISSSKASIFRASWIADYSDAENFLSLFYSKNYSPYGPNYTHFSNKLYDNLYDKLYFTNDKSTRMKLYNQMDSIIVNNFVVIPLYYDQIIRLTQKNVENLNLNKMNILNLETVKLN
ncbi:MAG: ABC transporter substrate-binding protein [Flavobacteriales bacterium]|nr:ABC transporter substrate-binding protein [Flavobacteriales bacterium]